MADDNTDDSVPEKNVLCCFCGSSIANGDVDPCQLVVTTNSGQWQVWFCHGQCFKSHLGSLPEASGFFAPAHF
jgi:hypothetical protein